MVRASFDAFIASLLGFCFGVSAVWLFTSGLFPRLGRVGCTFRQILSVLELLVNDFFVVRYVSWIGHGLL